MNRPEEGKSVSSNQSTKVIRLRHNYLALTNKLSIVNQQRLFFKKKFQDNNQLQSGLPDCLFSNQKSQFGCILEGLGIENVVIFYDRWEYFMAIWYNLW
jgi:hypothetical protein